MLSSRTMLYLGLYTSQETTFTQIIQQSRAAGADDNGELSQCCDESSPTLPLKFCHVTSNMAPANLSKRLWHRLYWYWQQLLLAYILKGNNWNCKQFDIYVHHKSKSESSWLIQCIAMLERWRGEALLLYCLDLVAVRPSLCLPCNTLAKC